MCNGILSNICCLWVGRGKHVTQNFVCKKLYWYDPKYSSWLDLLYYLQSAHHKLQNGFWRESAKKELYSQAGQTRKVAKAWTNSPIQIIPWKIPAITHHHHNFTTVHVFQALLKNSSKCRNLVWNTSTNSWQLWQQIRPPTYKSKA